MAWFITISMVLIVLLLDKKMLRKISHKERRIYMVILFLFFISNIMELNRLHMEYTNPTEWIYDNFTFMKKIYQFLEK